MIIYNFLKEIKAAKLQQEIIDAGLSTISYIDTVGEDVIIYFNEALTTEQQTALAALVDEHEASTSEEYVRQILQNATSFGQEIITEFTIQNILAGITASGKTGEVSDYLHKLNHYLNTGSLYEAINRLNEHIADSSETKTNLAPFITNTILTNYKERIEEYLGL